MIGARFQKVLGVVRKLGYACAGVLLCEVGARVAVPTPDALALSRAMQDGGGAMLRLYNSLAGGAVARGSVLALGFMPYASARMFLALAGMVSSRVREMSRRADGRKTLVTLTRALTTVLALIQSYGFARFTEQLPGVVAEPGIRYIAQTMLVLTMGALFMMWLCEHILAPSVEDEVADEMSQEHVVLGPAPFEVSAPRSLGDEDPVVVRRA